MAPRKAVDQELSREKILLVARELFVTKGYAQVSMRQIAKQLNYSHGALYYHFKNKAELFYALVTEDFMLLKQKLEELLAQDMDDLAKLEAVLLGYIQFGLEHPSHYEIMFLIKDHELNHLVQEEPNLVYEQFAQAIVTLSQRPISPMQAWLIFLAMHGFVAHYYKTGLSYRDVESLAKAHVQFVLKGVL